MDTVEFGDHPDNARVDEAEPLLVRQSARSICEEIGLNWWAAIKLHEDGWLSFDPRTTLELEEPYDVELRFIGFLVAGGCDSAMLQLLLKGLRKPYRYRAGDIYYDWVGKRWRLVPQYYNDPEQFFGRWIDALVEEDEVDTLSKVAEKATQALDTAVHPEK